MSEQERMRILDVREAWTGTGEPGEATILELCDKVEFLCSVIDQRDKTIAELQLTRVSIDKYREVAEQNTILQEALERIVAETEEVTKGYSVADMCRIIAREALSKVKSMVAPKPHDLAKQVQEDKLWRGEDVSDR